MEVCTKPKGVREKETFIVPVWKEQGTKRKKVLLNWKRPLKDKWKSHCLGRHFCDVVGIWPLWATCSQS